MVVQIKLSKDEAEFFDTEKNMLCSLEIGHVHGLDNKSFDINAVMCGITSYDENGKEKCFQLKMIEWYYGETDDLRDVVKVLREWQQLGTTYPIKF